MKLTDQQAAYVDAYRDGSDLVVEAGAGTGKSSTLRAGAEADRRRAILIAYNRSTADDAGRTFPWHVNCSTAHGLAYRAVGKRYRRRMNESAKQPAKVTAEVLARLNRPAYDIGLDATLHAAGLARLTLRTLDAWCKSADDYVLPVHVPDTPQLRPTERAGAVAAAVMLASTAWQDLQHDDESGKGELPFSHDCQPPGTLVRRVVQRGGTRGESTWEDVPIEQIREGDRVVSVTLTQRRGYVRRDGRPVTAVGYRDYSGDLITATTERGRSSSYTAAHKCLVRLDSDLADGNHVVYLARRGNDYRVGRTTWRTRSQQNASGLRRRAESQGADAMWVLSVHATDGAAALAEALASHQWRIPTWQFRSSNETMPLALFWSKVGNNGADARACLSAHGRHPEHPLWQRGDGWEKLRRPVVLRASNLLPGMLMLEPDEIKPGTKGELRAHEGAGGWSPITITRSPYDGPVYNLDVETDHTYIADGIATHNCYLKMWALTRPRLDVDAVMFDEAQDANPVIAGVVESQTHAQRVAVGDRCQPAGTLVAVVRGTATRAHRAVVEQVPIEQVRAGDKVVSFDMPRAFLRRSGSPVAGISVRPFDGELVSVATPTGETSRYTPDHHCIAQIAPALRDKHALYVMRRGTDYRIGITAGLHRTQGNRAGFILRGRAEKADAVWLLGLFDTRGEAAAAEAIASWRYGVPQLTFQSSNRSAITQEQLDAVWSEIGGNAAAATGLLASYGRDVEYPLWKQGGDALLVRRAMVVRACNLVDGMAVLTHAGAMDAAGKRAPRNHWSPIAVAREPYSGPVYSMTVERDHSYIGDGIVTHNCQAINGWNGAVDAMAGWRWARLTLSQSFRFGPAVADMANLWLDALESPLRLTGFEQLDTVVGYCPEPDAILCRGNVGAIVAADREVNDGRRVGMVGGTAEVKRLAFAARDLMAGRKTDHPQLYLFDDWDAVREFAEDEGSDLLTFVKMIDRFGPAWVLRLCADLVSEKDAEVVTSTVHKAKGREWPRVLIAGDFPQPGDVKPNGDPVEFTREDGMLAYVAVTRARELLDPGSLGWIEHTRPVFADQPSGVAA